MTETLHNPESEGPSGGWGSVKSIARILGDERPSPMVLEELARQNKPGGVMCVSCAWPKLPPFRILRERREGNDFGFDERALHARVLE
jgi:hypothetical protein